MVGERSENDKERRAAQYEIDRLHAERENLKRDHSLESETLREKLNEEKDRRIESKRKAQELREKRPQTQEEAPSDDNIYEHLRSGVTDFVKSFQGSIVDENKEEQLAQLEAESKSLKSELEEERNRRLRWEEWVIDLQAKLEANEAQLRELRESLSNEQERILQLETEKRVLDEIRLLLGTAAVQPAAHAEGVATADITDMKPEPNPADLQIQTRHGLWTFRPPFALESDEVELIRLVAGEDEMTAEQIKRRTGRRRSVDDLDELLDRLLAEGMEPIKESSDRYRFDPDILQD